MLHHEDSFDNSQVSSIPMEQPLQTLQTTNIFQHLTHVHTHTNLAYSIPCNTLLQTCHHSMARPVDGEGLQGGYTQMSNK